MSNKRPGIERTENRSWPERYALLLPILVSFSVLLAVPGCRTTPPPSEGTPKATFRNFANHIQNESYSKAYRYFSKDTRKRYKLNHFHGLMNKTLAGSLLQWKIQNWSIENVRHVNGNKAYVTLMSPDESKKNAYELVRETTKNGKPVWRIRYYLADELNMPRSDENFLFSRSGTE